MKKFHCEVSWGKKHCCPNCGSVWTPTYDPYDSPWNGSGYYSPVYTNAGWIVNEEELANDHCPECRFIDRRFTAPVDYIKSAGIEYEALGWLTSNEPWMTTDDENLRANAIISLRTALASEKDAYHKLDCWLAVSAPLQVAWDYRYWVAFNREDDNGQE